MHLLIVLLAAMGKFAVSLGLSFVVHLAAPHALWTGLVLCVAASLAYALARHRRPDG
jgi:hypothetical protein